MAIKPGWNRRIKSLSILLGLLLGGCQQGQSRSRPALLPQDALIQVYFNQNPAADYREPYRQQTRDGDDLEQLMVDEIGSAQSTIELAVQELRLPKVAQALVQRHQAGVKVRVILENLYSRPWGSFSPTEIAKLPPRERDRYQEYVRLVDLDGDGQLTPTEINQRDALILLANAGIPWLDDTANGSKGSDLMHHKFMVVDGQRLIVTSANLTPSDTHGDLKSLSSRGNANNLLKINSGELAALFVEEFNLMWGDGTGGLPDSKFGVQKPARPVRQLTLGKTTLAVHFSPTSSSQPWESSSNGLIGQTLAQATRSVNLALFVFSEQRLADILETVHQQGRQIQVLIDPGFAYRSYSEGLDMLGVTLRSDCKLEAANRPWATPIKTVGVPRLPPGDLLHHKFGLVDNEIVLTGSHNWTSAANTGNDETLLVLRNPVIAAHYQREFERLYGNAILGVPPAIARKAKDQQQQCAAAIALAPSSPSPALTSPPTEAQRINLNTATQLELERLPGVGPGLAQRIIAARQQKPFTALSDLDAVSGVGERLLEKLEPYVTW